MGVGTEIGAGPTGTGPNGTGPTGTGVAGRALGWVGSARALRALTAATLAANVALVVTGGAVRLTNSGLGCPTWPSCTSTSLTPTRAYALHGVIEFTNRQLTFVLVLLAAATAVAAWRQRSEVRLAMLGLLGIPGQAVLGGITVRTDLNPYAVGCHFLLSMAVIAVYVVLAWRLAGGRPVAVPAAVLGLARALAVVTGVVLVLGTLVTGSGPHAGDVKAGRVHRIHLATAGLTQLHADAVMVLIGLSLGMLAIATALRVVPLVRPVGYLVAVVLAQGMLGYVQYFLHVPALLVVLHMLGAGMVWLAAWGVLVRVDPRASRQRTSGSPTTDPPEPARHPVDARPSTAPEPPTGTG